MDSEQTEDLVLRERRVALLRQLALALRDAQKDIAGLRPRHLLKHMESQNELCMQLANLNPRAGCGTTSTPAGSVPGQASPGKVVAQQIIQLESEIRHLNQVQAVLLRKAVRFFRVSGQNQVGCASIYVAPR